MRRSALLLGLAALLCVPPALAESTTSLTGSADAPAPIAPGGEGNATLTVHYCYRSQPVSPTTVQLATKSAPDWLSASYDPASFTADASSQCGQRDVAVHLSLGRDSPALQPGTLAVSLTPGSGSGGEASIPVQASYAAELKVTPPATVTVPRGDQARFDLTISVAANGGTIMEILGRDASGKLTIQGQSIAVPGAGKGLDQPVQDTYHINLAASPGAALGAGKLPLELTTKYSTNPAYTGDDRKLDVPVDVVDAPAKSPGFEAGLLVLGLAGLLAARRR